MMHCRVWLVRSSLYYCSLLPSPSLPLPCTPFPSSPRFLMKFLHELSHHEEVTKMGARNIGLVLGPNLLWSRESLEEVGRRLVCMGEVGSEWVVVVM